MNTMQFRHDTFNENINLAYHLAHVYRRNWPQFHIEEMIQHALIALWKLTKYYDPKKGKLSALFNKTYFNELRMAHRHIAKQPPTTTLDEAYTLSVTDDHFNPAKEQVANILIKLNKLEKTIVALRLEGLTQLEIGIKLNKTQAQVSRLLKKIKEKL